jgi:cytoskeletal protein RodZ
MVMSGENRDPRVQPEIGRSLERARKSRGLTLWQVEQETRIRSRYLRDLEQGDFDVLPAVYVLGSLKTYADFLGLDGAALSRQLKASLVEPVEPDVPEQLATLGGTRDEDDEYEAAPVPAVGFDQLFLGMGVILISILAVMTIVAAVAQGDESPVSQINQPSTSESPSEIALAGNVQDGDGVERAGNDDPVEDENEEDQPEAPKDEDGEESKDVGQSDGQDASQSASPFGDADFAPMPPSSSPPDAASASASQASASPAPATAEPDDSQEASTAPAATAPASTGASPEPARDAPAAASPSPAAPGGGGSPQGAPQAGGGEGGQTPPAGEADSDLISAETDRIVDEALDDAGIVR